MKKIFLFAFLAVTVAVTAQTDGLETIKLNAPDLQRGESVMQALLKRKSTRVFAEKELSLQDLSDLLWAANGINRPEAGRRTAPSAMNRQDIQIYVCTANGSYLYDAKTSELQPISTGDARPLKGAPVCLILVSDTTEGWGAIDGGIVSQNISIFCAGTGMATVARGTMNHDELKAALKLADTQQLILNHPVGYPE
jgi:Nitroreductase